MVLNQFLVIRFYLRYNCFLKNFYIFIYNLAIIALSIIQFGFIITTTKEIKNKNKGEINLYEFIFG